MGVALSITAFPVLARILTDRGLSRTPLGVMALTCAAGNDVTAWCLLALVVGVAQAQVAAALSVLLGAMGYLAVMFFVIRPIATRWAMRHGPGRLSPKAVGLVFICLLLSALATQAIGIHAIFGAFLFGAVIPHDSPVARDFTARMADLVAV